MKFLISTLLIGVASWAIAMFTPWWGFAIVAFLVGAYFQLKGGIAFLSGFVGVGVLFGVLAYLADSTNDSILSTRIATMLGLPSPFLTVVISAVVGGLVAGLAALSGSLGRQIR